MINGDEAVLCFRNFRAVGTSGSGTRQMVLLDR